MSEILHAHNCRINVSGRDRLVGMAQPAAGGQGEADKLAAFAVGVQLLRQAFATHGGGVGVGDNQAAIFRHHVHRKTGGNRKIEPFAERQIFLPFPVAAIIGDRTLDLDDDKFAIPVDRHHVDPPAIRQFEFGQRPEAKVLKQFAYAACQQAGGFRDVTGLIE